MMMMAPIMFVCVFATGIFQIDSSTINVIVHQSYLLGWNARGFREASNPSLFDKADEGQENEDTEEKEKEDGTDDDRELVASRYFSSSFSTKDENDATKIAVDDEREDSSSSIINVDYIVIIATIFTVYLFSRV